MRLPVAFGVKKRQRLHLGTAQRGVEIGHSVIKGRLVVVKLPPMDNPGGRREMFGPAATVR